MFLGQTPRAGMPARGLWEVMPSYKLPTRKEIVDLIATVRYKTGAEIKLYDVAYGSPAETYITLLLPILLIDSGRPDMLRSTVKVEWTGRRWEEAVILAIRKLIHQAELHEADEQLTVGGHRVFDPHWDEPFRMDYRQRQKTPLEHYLSHRDEPKQIHRFTFMDEKLSAAAEKAIARMAPDYIEEFDRRPRWQKARDKIRSSSPFWKKHNEKHGNRRFVF